MLAHNVNLLKWLIIPTESERQEPLIDQNFFLKIISALNKLQKCPHLMFKTEPFFPLKCRYKPTLNVTFSSSQEIFRWIELENKAFLREHP